MLRVEPLQIRWRKVVQQREKSARQQGHPCLRFVHDFVSVVLNTRNSCGQHQMNYKAASSRSFFFAGFATAEIFVLICTVVYLENLVLAIPYVVFNLFTLVRRS